MFKKTLLSLCMVFSLAHASPQAEQMIQSIGDEVIELLKNDQLTLQDRANSFEKIFKAHFKMDAIAKFVLGKYWRQASKEERAEFKTLFTDVTVYNYAKKFQEYTAVTFKVTGSRQDDGGAIMVMSEIERPNGNPIHVQWKVFEKKGTPLIYDVFLENVSMSITQRSEYASVIQKEGGKVAGLNAVLQDKLASYKTQ